MKTDRLSDMLTRIRNGYLAGKKTVEVPHTNYLEKVASVLVEEKYLGKLEVQKHANSKIHKTIVLTLTYVNGQGAISKLKRVSKPGVRIYQRASELRPVLSGMGLAIVSTSAGVMTGRKAKKQKLGGEVLFELW